MSAWARANLFLAACLFSIYAQPAPAASAAIQPTTAPSGRGIQGDIDLLTKTAEVLKGNIDRLHTWQAEVTEETREIGRPMGPSHWKYQTTFVYDRPRDAVRWEWRVMPTWDWPLKVGPAQRWRTLGMMVDKAVYHLGTMPIDQRPKSAMLHIQQVRGIPERRGDIIDEFHPMAFLHDRPERSHEMLLWYHKHAGDGKLTDVTVKSEGTRVILESGSKSLINRYTFDLAVGGNIVEYCAEAPSERCIYTFTFEPIKGVFLPKTVNRQTSQLVAGVRIESMDAASFKTIAVNERLGKDEFTVQKLGVQRGDRVQDDIRKISYVLQ